jgi:antitoxin (DNA-binding transcriptional repressor) of toxin-antitoxin stability system
MASYTVAEARNALPKLIKKAEGGEEVVITRHGKPVVEIRARRTPKERASRESYERLIAQRDARKPLEVDSVTLLDEIHDETVA